MNKDKLKEVEENLQEKGLKYKVIDFAFSQKLIIDENGVLYKT